MIVGLVGRYPANCLIGREPILKRINPLVSGSCGPLTLCGISTDFSVLFPTEGQVAHALLTRPPLSLNEKQASFLSSVRLACVKHAASVHPEPGSNSHVDMLLLNEQLRCEFSKTIVLHNLTRQRRSRASSLV